MKIGIDARLLERRMTGIGRYLANIVRRIPVCDQKNEYVLFSYRPLPGFPKENVTNIATINAAAGGMLQKIRSALWLHAILPRFLKKEKIDILFSPNTLLPALTTATKNVITIPDVFQLVDRTFHSPFYRAYISLFLAGTLKKADCVLTISEASKRDIVKLLHVPEGKITVTYLAADERFMPRAISPKERDRYAKKYGLPARFILYIGVLEKKEKHRMYYKNRRRSQRKNGCSHCSCRASRDTEEKDILQKLKKRKKYALILEFPDDADLPYLYDLAELFLFSLVL